MPRSTAQYVFERWVLAWALNFRAEAGFLVLFGPEGELLEVHEADTAQFGNRLVSHERKDRLTQSHPSWLFFDPFDWPEYAWLQWNQVPRATLEQLIEPWAKLFRPEKGEPQKLPESWGVMF